MASTKEMAEAHLKNVESQIQQLEQQKTMIDSDIEKLRGYLNDGVKELSEPSETAGGSEE
jgi:hypothetical protein